MKRVRAARHYQRDDDPVLRLSRSAMRGVARELKHAFNNLSSMVPVKSVAEAIRNGRDPKGLINWHHYREVLRGAFDRLGKLRHAGGALGARKINGAFAAKRRKVRFRKAGYTHFTSEGAVLGATKFAATRKASKAEAGYEERSSHGATCSECWMFQAVWRCCAVEGVINPNGWCTYWETVFAKTYNPDEPRDERGRWTTGGITASEFIAARDLSSRIGFMSPLSPDDLSGHTLLANTDRTVGVAIDKHGDLQNLFNNGGAKGEAAKAITAAIASGARTLDCYDGFLPSYYRQFGFEETGRLKFNAEFAHGWDTAKYGEPDVVFMAWKGYLPGGAEGAIERATSRQGWVQNERAGYASDYDSAKADSRRAAIDSGSGAGAGPQAKRSADRASLGAGTGAGAALAKATGDQFNFDSFSPAVQAEVRDEQDRLIQQLEADARDTIDAIISSGLADGTSVDDMAADIADSIGLTDTQWTAVNNYRNMLEELDPDSLVRRLRNTEYDAVVQDAIDAQTDLSATAIENMVSDYIENYIDYRAATIAQTESTRAANLGLHDAYDQAIDRGALTDGAITRFWQLGDNPCPVCESIVDNNPEGVSVGESFDSLDGPVDDPPVHPNCECSVDYVTDLNQVPDDGEEQDIGPGSFGVGGVDTPYMDDGGEG